jgi:hypothetical protein
MGTKLEIPRVQSAWLPSMPAMVLRPLRKVRRGVLGPVVDMQTPEFNGDKARRRRDDETMRRQGLTGFPILGLLPVRCGDATWPPTPSSARFFLRKTTAALLGRRLRYAGKPSSGTRALKIKDEYNWFFSCTQNNETASHCCLR